MTGDQAVPLPPDAVEALADELVKHLAITVRGREGYEAVKARLRRAAAQGAAAEREACAKLADQEAELQSDPLTEANLRDVAALIRARATP